MQIARTDIGTEGEGEVLPPWCDQHQFGSIVLVAAKDHSRRLRRVIDRAMKDHPTRVMIQPTRYSGFDGPMVENSRRRPDRNHRAPEAHP
jgi:hypothetical protein